MLGKESRPAVLLRRGIAFLAAPRLPLFLTAAAVLVSLPALWAGLFTDDYLHRALLMGDSPAVEELAQVDLAPEGSGRLATALSDLFVVVDPERNLDRFRSYGNLPWWTGDGYRVAHWRPVAALTHWLDYRLFPDAVWLMHLHSVLWFAAVVGVVTLLYRRLIDRAWIAGLAGLLYLLCDDSYFPTAWLANRNLLISLFFAIVTLIAHDRWRRGHWKAGVVVVPLCLLASVLATEGGVATFAYLFAYEVALAQGSWSRRGLALAPSVAVIVLWRLGYNLQGYGAAGGGFYVDPVSQPVDFLAAVIERAPVFLGGQWTTTPCELYGLIAPGGRPVLWLLLLVPVVGLPLGLWPWLRVSRRARFWLLGMYGSVVPICATVPMSRALLFVAIGAFGFVAECLGGCWERVAWMPRSPWRRRCFWGLALGLLIVHLPWAALTRGFAPKAVLKTQKDLNRTLAIGLFLRLQPHQRLIVVNPPNPAALVSDPFWAVYNGKGLPANIRMLVPGYGRVEIARPGPRRLVIKSLTGSFLDCGAGWHANPVYFYQQLSDVRGSDHWLEAGMRFELAPVTIEILAVDERGRPLEVACDFDEPLVEGTLRWIYWNWGRPHFQVFRPPAVGTAICLPGPF